MYRCLLVSAILMGVLLTAPSAHAVIGVGARAGYLHHRHIDDNSIMYGAMARLETGVIGFEAALDSRSGGWQDGIELKERPITLSVMVRPVPVVHGFAGVGWYRARLEFPGSTSIPVQTDNSIGFHYGAGVEWPLVPFLKLTGDVRFHHVEYEFDESVSGVGTVDADALSVSAGLLFSL